MAKYIPFLPTAVSQTLPSTVGKVAALFFTAIEFKFRWCYTFIKKILSFILLVSSGLLQFKQFFLSSLNMLYLMEIFKQLFAEETPRTSLL